MIIIYNIISLTVIILILLPWILYDITKNLYFFKMSIGIIIAEIIHEILKWYIFSTKYEFSKRPKGAYGCGLFCNGGNVEGRPGMPSGHMTATLFFYTMLLNYLYITDKLMFIDVFILSIIHISLMAISRYQKRCHSILQIISGGILGIILALFFIYL